jgi:actin-like ATPase involved in cell morphogenesis
VPIDGYLLGVDFGTSHTVAVLRWPDGRTRPLLFDGSPLLSSAVFAAPGGTILVGRDALLAGRVQPERLEPHPKRCVDHGRLLLGEPGGVPVELLIEAVLLRVAAEATRIAGGRLGHAVLCCPADWGAVRRRTLVAAASRVLPRVSVVAEPIAAASHFVAAAGHPVPPGGVAMVYDLGAGTFDASVVRRTRDGFEVLAAEGLSDAGGLDIDAAIVAYLGATYAAVDPATWERLVNPASTADRRASRTLWDDVRVAKETLSHAAGVQLHVPLFDDEVPFGREQLEQLARPILDRTVEVSRSVLRAAGVPATGLAGLFLVGGASRIPLAATLLHRALGVAPTAIEQPELAVAEGSVGTAGAGAAGAGAAGAGAAGAGAGAAGADHGVVGWQAGRPNPTYPRSAPATGPAPDAVPRRAVAAAVAVLGVLVVAFLVAVLSSPGDRGGRGGNGVDPRGAGPGAGGPGGGGQEGAGQVGAPEIDPCLVGTWLETAHTIPVAGYVVTGSGATHSFRSDGTATVDYGEGTAFANPGALGAYRMIVSGTITQEFTTRDNKIHTRNAKAEGTVTIEYQPIRQTEKLTAAPGPIDYACDDDSLTLTITDGQEIELSRAD